jgi:ElaA protein
VTSEALTATLHRSWAADLEPRTLYEILRLRVDVFVVEQECPYPELDGRDLEPRARHYWLSAQPHRTGGERAEPVLGCVRLLKEPDGAYRIGRLCTAPAARGHGLGRQLMEAVLAEVGDGTCLLDAQEHLAGFYADFGFEVIGPAYDWAGVAHLPMRRVRR